MPRPRATAFLYPLIILFTAFGASAFVLLDPPRTWDSAPTYIVDQTGFADITDGDNGVTQSVNAIQSNAAWNGAGSGTVVQAEAGDVTGFTLGDGVPMIVFGDPLNVCTGTCIAGTFTGYFSSRGDGTTRIEDADIVMNPALAWTSMGEDPNESTCSNEYYVEAVLVHEVGHGLGLGESTTINATMNGPVAICDQDAISITQDDADGLNALYSGGSPGPAPPRTWDTPPTFIIDDRGISSVSDATNGYQQVIDALNSRVSGWNSTDAGTILRATAGSMAGFSLGDGIPMINFQDPINFCTGNCLALAFTGFTTTRPDGTLRIDDADIVTNSSAHDWTSGLEDPGGVGCSGEYYIEAVIMREVGRAMGLDYTSFPDATMSSQLDVCDNRATTLDGDDIANIESLYGPWGSCAGNCGGQALGGCYCDSQCATMADCCEDKVAICG